MTYSDYIYEIADWLRRCGLTVIAPHPLPSGVAGRYDHDQRLICVGSGYSARDALFTIAHEAGRWLGYLIDPKPHSYQRERQAFVYGWHVLRWFDAPVSREEWIVDDREGRSWVAWGRSG